MSMMKCPKCWGVKTMRSLLGTKPCDFCGAAGVVTDRQLSPNFALSEALSSNKAVRLQLDNSPTEEDVQHLIETFTKLVQPFRDEFGPIHVDSAFRKKAVNAAVGGTDTSAHVCGYAADLVPLADGVTVKTLIEWGRRQVNLPFDQLIYEGTWLHVGLLKPGLDKPRRQVYMMFGGTYFPYDPEDARVI